jgi:leucyl/phenylalanyl-tRNA---protein transferase
MNSRKEFSDEYLLEPANMILMYANGAFPMADENGKIDWYLPEIRTIIPLQNFNIPRSLKNFYRSAGFIYKVDSAILDVIYNCANRESTWISSELINAYKGLIKIGHVHSVETFLENELVGGLYGITYKGAFFGESMFSKVTQASKCALVKLIEILREKNFSLLDVQFQTEHLKMFGAIEIPLEKFVDFLSRAHKLDVSFN